MADLVVPKAHPRPTPGSLFHSLFQAFGFDFPRIWKTDAVPMGQPKAEEYLRRNSPAPELTDVKLVHTFDEWVSERGAVVRVGTGLTTAKTCHAKRFLKGEDSTPCQFCETEEQLPCKILPRDPLPKVVRKSGGGILSRLMNAVRGA